MMKFLSGGARAGGVRDGRGKAAAVSSGSTPEKAGPRPAPRHVAIIMDGNGRWAVRRGLPRIAGHRKGTEVVKEVTRAAARRGVEYLTIYAFSTENWRRPEEEVAGLMDLFRVYLRREVAELCREEVRLRFIGDRSALSPTLQALMAEAEEKTAPGRRMTLMVALNYGGRSEITRAIRDLAGRAARGEIDPATISEDAIGAALDTGDVPDPDLVIRTSGELRLSNFLLWQAAYSELIFAPECWPDFGAEGFLRAVEEYLDRDRRYGGVKA